MSFLERVSQEEVVELKESGGLPLTFAHAVESSVNIESIQEEVDPFLNTKTPFLVQDLTNYNTRIKAFPLFDK